ncbi:hypothetical protein [Haloarchaeobius baliensis]|uniref:hypothetical protein n=1 Tax=Haloarchaeobius baliensis TaxID=1670458 RepID=UPI003F881F03
MSRERASLSRRQLLGSVGGVGALGGASGLGTWALFEDGETFTGSLAAGAVGVTLDCDGCTTASDGSVSFDFADLGPGDRGVETFTVSADANPMRVWLRTNCPAPVDPLGDAVELRLFHDGDCEGPAAGTAAYPADGSWVSLNEFRTALRGGLRLDHRDAEACLDGTLCLDFEYRLPDDATWAAALSTDLTFEVVAEQCRHVPEDGVASPFPPADCPELDCPDCVDLGKLEVEGDLLMPGVYEFDELYAPFDDGTTYALEVLTATNKADDAEEETVCVSFRLLAGESGDGLAESNAPAICSVAVKGGPLTATYDVAPPSTRTRGEVCTVAQDGDTAPGGLPAISNLVVSVCDDGEDGDGPGDDCSACPSADGEGERITQATFGYTGPDDVDVVFGQQSSGGSSGDDAQVTGVEDGDSFTVSLGSSGRPDFVVSVADGDASTDLSVPAQSDPSVLHTSCSQVFAVGMELVDDIDNPTYRLTVESALNAAGESLCEVSD